jgi:hypothetical protein
LRPDGATSEILLAVLADLCRTTGNLLRFRQEEKAVNHDLWYVAGNVARGNDPREAPDQTAPLVRALFPWLAVARLVVPAAGFIALVFIL